MLYPGLFLKLAAGTMADSTLMTVVRKYKSALDGDSGKDVAMSVLRKLERINMTLEILQATRIGKTVNKLRKWNGEIGALSNRIINAWKGIASKSKDDTGKLSNNKVATALDMDKQKHRHYNAHENADHLLTKDSLKIKSEKEKPSPSSSIHSSKVSNEINDKKSCKSVKRKHSDPSSSSSSTLSKRKPRTASDDETNNLMSFEDCLGMSDNRSSKKKNIKPSHNSTKLSFSEKCTAESRSQNSRHGESSSKVKLEISDDRDEARHSNFNRNSCPSVPKLPTFLEKVVEAPLPVLTLPEIQPNYRPIRNHFIIDDTNVNQRKKPIDCDSNYFMSSRHNRTQVFSGRKVNYITEVPTLKDACLRVLQDNPNVILQERRPMIFYDILKPVIDRLTPEQLYELELNNEDVTADTCDLWEAHCKREFRTINKHRDESWQEFYWRLVRERDIKLKSITANISASMSKSLPVRQTKLAYVNCIAKPPRGVARQQAKFGTGKIIKPDADKHMTSKAKLINAITASVANSTDEVVPFPSSSSQSSNQSNSPSPSTPQQKGGSTDAKNTEITKKSFSTVKNVND